MIAASLARPAVLRMLAGVRGGMLEIVEGDRALTFGEPGAELAATVEVHDPRAFAAVLRGSVGWGESYVAGWWDCEDLVALTRIAARSIDGIDRLRGRLQPVLGPVQRRLERVPRNTRSGAAANISAHYDLGNELFATFLDERMLYSSAVFEHPAVSLERAQLAKLRRICDRLELGPGDHLLEIGTGWGALAVHAALEHGCRVTTTTVSREQHAYASALVSEAGIGDRVEVLLRDYRDLEGSYDKLASIEMIEAVGWQYFGEFFDRCAELLRPGGGFFLQAITIADHLYEQEKASRSFANTHVFPGGCLPSLELVAARSRAAGLTVERCEDVSDDYALTIAEWSRRFERAWPQLCGRGYDERFRRLWRFYLATSEAGFRERRIRDLQLTLAKPGRPTAAHSSARRSTAGGAVALARG